MSASKAKTHIWLKQTRSMSGQPKPHRLLLKGLGLGRIGKVSLLKDNAPIRGMVIKVQHLIMVEVREGELK